MNLEAQCDQSSGTSRDAEKGPLETEWITEALIARTQDVWGGYLGREVGREEAIEMLLNIQRIALAFYQASKEGSSE